MMRSRSEASKGSGSVDDVRGDHTLAERFVQLSGGLSDVEGLEWLHTYSD